MNWQSARAVLIARLVVGVATPLYAQKSSPAPDGKVADAKSVATVPVREVSQGLHPDRTDVQRNAYWPTVSGKDVRWVITVDEVTTGWFSGFKVRGMVTNSMQVSCELEEKPEIKALVGKINKGDRVTCVGKLKTTFVVLLGLTTLSIEGTELSRN